MRSTDPGATPALVIDGLDARYGLVPVLRDVTLRVEPGERVALIGANGAGKTTLLRAISGLLRPRAGGISFGSRDLLRLPPHAVVRTGVVQVAEGRQVFARQSVIDNLLLGAHSRKDRRVVGKDLDLVLDAMPQLRERLRTRAVDLSGGQQQMLAIGRALMAAPRLLMVDELSLGLAPVLADEIADLVSELTATRGMSLLVVEQNVAIALHLSDRTYVLRNGAISGEYASEHLAGNRELVMQYLGA